MVPPPPTPDDTRERILQAAIDVLAEDGMAGFTHRRVEDRAGVSHGSTTYHFGTRDDLLGAATERILELEAQVSAQALYEATGVDGSTMTGAPLRTDIDWTSPAGIAFTRRIAQATLTAMATQSRTVLARFEIYLHAARHPETAQRLTAARHAIYAAQEEQARLLGYPEPELYARLITSLIDGLVIHHLGVPDQVILDRGPDLLVSCMVPLHEGLPARVNACKDIPPPTRA